MTSASLAALLVLLSPGVSIAQNPKDELSDVQPFTRQLTNASLLPPRSSLATHEAVARNLGRTEKHYIGLEVGITTSMQFGGENYAVAGIYPDGVRNAELTDYAPEVSYMAGVVVDIAFNKDLGFQGKAAYRMHKANAQGISPAGNISGRDPQLKNNVNFTWDYLAFDALLRAQLMKNAIYVLGGVSYSKLQSNFVSGVQASSNNNGEPQQMGFEGELTDFYAENRIDAKLGIGTWLPLGDGGVMIAPELMIGFPLTSLHSQTTIDKFEAIDRRVNNMAYASLGFALKFPIGGNGSQNDLSEPLVSSAQNAAPGATSEGRKIILSGRIVDESYHPINAAQITVVDLSNNQVINSVRSEDGSFTAAIPGPGRFSVSANAPGYLFGSGLYEVDAEGKVVQRPKEIKLAPATDGRVRLLLFFDFDKATLGADSYPELDRAAALMQADMNMRVEIAGYTDAQGSYSYNKDLSQRRANAVSEYLIRQGIDAARLTAVGYGEENPVATNDTEDGRSENRRVEFVVVKH